MTGHIVSARSRRCFAASGFTLIEMTVVLAILAGAAAVIGIAARPLRERSLVVQSARAVGALIVRAEAMATREGRPSQILFAETGSIEITGTRHRIRLDPAVTFTVTTAREAGRAGEQTLIFMPDGTGTGGVIRFAVSDSATPGRTVRVSWLTGAISDAP